MTLACVARSAKRSRGLDEEKEEAVSRTAAQKQKRNELYTVRCAARYTDSVNNTDLAKMHKINSIVAVKAFKMAAGHLHCKNRLTAQHEGKEKKLCFECKQGYYLLVDGAILPESAKDGRYAKAVGTCQLIEGYKGWSKAQASSKAGSMYDIQCLKFRHSAKGMTRTVDGTLEMSQVHNPAKAAYSKMSDLGYMCNAAPIMQGFYLYPRKNYLVAYYAEQSTTRFVACHSTAHSAYALKCTQRKIEGPCTKVCNDS